MSFDFLVVGGGSAGCVLAARLSQDGSRSVGLVEAGPDYGPYSEGRWPAEILNPRVLPVTHNWGYEGGNGSSRARILGGCSAHNACLAVRGAPEDYDEWADYSDGVWDFSQIEPYLARAELALGVRPQDPEALGPWDTVVLQAAAELGFQPEDLNQWRSEEGAGSFPVNIVNGVRWNTSFAYVDSARGRPNLTILADTVVDRIRIQQGCAVGAEALSPDGHVFLKAETVIMAAGAYATPACLLRSGVGPEGLLRRLGIHTELPREGVGRNLRDHFGSWLEFRVGDSLRLQLAEQADRGLLYETSAAIRAASPTDRSGRGNLHILAWSDVGPDPGGGWTVYLAPKLMKPASRGRVTIRSRDPKASPVIDHPSLTDPAERDTDLLVAGLELCRAAGETKAVSDLAVEASPGKEVRTSAEWAQYASLHFGPYFHPVGTCRMGAADDPDAVVDGMGRVHGIDRLVIADASIMPSIPRANTALTVVAVAKRLGDELR